MRFLCLFSLIFCFVNGNIVGSNDKKLVCPPQMTQKHNWKVESFLGSWHGVELYSHINDSSFFDTCLKLKINEVNDQQDDDVIKPDPCNQSLPLRHLSLKFSYLTNSLSYDATVNMTNAGVWKGDNITVNVQKSSASELLLTVSQPVASKHFSILLQKDDDDEYPENSKRLIQAIFGVKQLKVYSITPLDLNCTIEMDDEPLDSSEPDSGSKVYLSFISILTLLLTRFLSS